MNREPVNPDDPQLTNYALGEMPASEAAEFEARLKISPLAQSELSAMSDISSMLSRGLKAEWERQMPVEIEVNMDDPKFTAYALGELSEAEAVEVEAELGKSSNARKDVDSMSEIMSMLSVGLKDEWQSNLEKPHLSLIESEQNGLESDKIVSVSFGETKRAWMGVAAAAVALLGATFTFFSTSEPTEVANWGGTIEDAAVIASVDQGNSHGDVMVVASTGDIQVPRLLMAEEVDDISQLNLVADAPFGVDASYLDSEDVIPVGKRSSMKIVPAGYAPAAVERVGSYFDSASVQGANYLGTTASPFSSKDGVGILNFSPEVSGIQNSIDREVLLAAEFQGIQIELEQIVAELPEGSQERKALDSLLERNTRALNALKYQFSQ